MRYCHATIRMNKVIIIIIVKKLILSNVAKNETNWSLHTLPVGMPEGTDTLENSLAVSCEVRMLL